MYQVRGMYRENPFHNWYHGFSVLHFTYITLKTLAPEMASYLNPAEVMGLLVASLCHDVDHPGFNNTYEIVTESERAIKYNDISVLENHHSYVMLMILRQYDIFKNFERLNYRAVKKFMVNSVLATDMSVHFSTCSSLDSRSPEAPFTKSDADRQLFSNMLIHSSDLSAQTFVTNVALEWESRITTEFMHQVECEKKAGLEVTKMMNNLDDIVIRNKSQLGFIDYMLLPWWKNVSRLFPSLTPCLDNLLLNRQHYAQIVQQHTAPTQEDKSA